MAIRSSIGGSAPVAAASIYPRLMQAAVSGNVWLVTAPKTGVVVHVGAAARDAKGPGYTSRKLVETKLRPFTGEVRLQA